MTRRQKFGYVPPKMSKGDQDIVDYWAKSPETAKQEFLDNVHARAVAKEIDPDPVVARAVASVSKLSPIAIPQRLREFLQREHLS